MTGFVFSDGAAENLRELWGLDAEHEILGDRMLRSGGYANVEHEASLRDGITRVCDGDDLGMRGVR